MQEEKKQNTEFSAKTEKMSPIDLKIVELVITEPAISTLEISRRLDIDWKTARDHLAREDVKEAIKDHQINTIQLFQELQWKAIKTLESLMNSDDETIKLNASKEIIKPMQTLNINAKVESNTVSKIEVEVVGPKT